jgi:hypothetical protein
VSETRLASKECQAKQLAESVPPMLWAQGKTNAAVRLERLWDDVAKQHGLDILCAYPASNFPGGEDERVFNTICAEHSAVLPAE